MWGVAMQYRVFPTIIAVISLCLVFPALSCKQQDEPEYELDPTVIASAITVGYTDGQTIEVNIDDPLFKEISDESLSLVHSSHVAVKTIVTNQELSEIKLRGEYVQLSFDPSIDIETSIDTGEGYAVFENTSYVVIMLDDPIDDIDQPYICNTDVAEFDSVMGWRIHKSNQSFSKLESMIETMR